jgi:hypothetical protein
VDIGVDYLEVGNGASEADTVGARFAVDFKAV